MGDRMHSNVTKARHRLEEKYSAFFRGLKSQQLLDNHLMTTFLGDMHFQEGKAMDMGFKRATNARSMDEKQPGGQEHK